ncbi:MAG: hypothetical protein IKT38_00020 [Clostridia bacterium]|nr:hypothetical protein [Clostridia bacterium]
MYNFLLSIRELSVAVKIIISVGLFLFGGPLLVMVFLIFVAKSKDTNPDKFCVEIDSFKSNYDKPRTYVDSSEENIICFGSYVCELEGKICYLSKFISIYAKNISNSITSAYPNIEQMRIENDVYFQFPIKKNYSKTAKITIILAIIQYINEKYRDDKIHFDKSIPIGMSAVGLNKIINNFQNI